MQHGGRWPWLEAVCAMLLLSGVSAAGTSLSIWVAQTVLPELGRFTVPELMRAFSVL
jgi:hypothetical protein